MRRFYFDKRWIRDEEIRASWDPECISSPMFRVVYKIKKCRMELIKWNRQQESNFAIKIQKLKREMDELRGREN